MNSGRGCRGELRFGLADGIGPPGLLSEGLAQESDLAADFGPECGEGHEDAKQGRGGLAR